MMIISKWFIMFLLVQLSGILIGLLIGEEHCARSINNRVSEPVPAKMVMMSWVGLSFVALMILLLAHVVFGWDTSAYFNPF